MCCIYVFPVLMGMMQMVDFQQSSFKRANFCLFLIGFLHIMYLLKDLLKKRKSKLFLFRRNEKQCCQNCSTERLLTTINVITVPKCRKLNVNIFGIRYRQTCLERLSCNAKTNTFNEIVFHLNWVKIKHYFLTFQYLETVNEYQL